MGLRDFLWLYIYSSSKWINLPTPETLFTYPCAILHNDQNSLIHKSERRVNLTLIDYINKTRHMSSERGPLDLYDSSDFLKIQLCSWFNTPLQIINCNPILYVNNNRTLCARVHDMLSIVFNLLMNWCL